MALFQKKPQAGFSTNLYTLSQNKTLLVVGLGNVGREYDGTRHNVGFAGVDRFARDHDFTPWAEKKDHKCYFATATLGDAKVIAIKPTTFMNLSGQAVRAVASFYKILPENIVAIYDELDIPFGQIRTRIGGGSAGHNGVKSLINTLGEDFGRVRIGTGPKTPEQMDTADFVLARFGKDQEEQMTNLVREVSAILSEYAYSGNQLPAETRTFLV